MHYPGRGNNCTLWIGSMAAIRYTGSANRSYRHKKLSLAHSNRFILGGNLSAPGILGHSKENFPADRCRTFGTEYEPEHNSGWCGFNRSRPICFNIWANHKSIIGNCVPYMSIWTPLETGQL